MSMSPQKTKERLDRRSRSAREEGRDARATLLEAAATVFARRGFREATVDEVAREAGFSKGAVYWHFKSKDDLFFALVEDRVDAPLEEMVELLRSAPPEIDMAPEAARRFLELFERERETILLEQEYWLLVAREPQLRERYLARCERLRNALADALDARAEQLGTPELPLPSIEVATAYIALIDGLAQTRLVDPDAVPDHLLGEIVALVYRGLVARAEEAAAG